VGHTQEVTPLKTSRKQPVIIRRNRLLASFSDNTQSLVPEPSPPSFKTEEATDRNPGNRPAKQTEHRTGSIQQQQDRNQAQAPGETASQNPPGP